ncbi:hypothetical protein MKA48_11220 [[Clostridium] innocuum]|nr:hypothetical protein [[Clostridium] innocuum]
MNKIKYHKVRDCYYPDLKINENKIELTRFGSELLEYMQQHRNTCTSQCCVMDRFVIILRKWIKR